MTRPIAAPIQMVPFNADLPENLASLLYSAGKLSPGEYIYLSFSSRLYPTDLTGERGVGLAHYLRPNKHYWQFLYAANTNIDGTERDATWMVGRSVLVQLYFTTDSPPWAPKNDPIGLLMAQLLQERFVIVSGCSSSSSKWQRQPNKDRKVALCCFRSARSRVESGESFVFFYYTL